GQERVQQRPAAGRRDLPVGQRVAGAGPAAAKGPSQTQVHQVGRARRYHRRLQQLEQGILPTTQTLIHGLAELRQGGLCCGVLHLHSIPPRRLRRQAAQVWVALCPNSSQDDKRGGARPDRIGSI